MAIYTKTTAGGLFFDTQLDWDGLTVDQWDTLTTDQWHGLYVDDAHQAASALVTVQQGAIASGGIVFGGAAEVAKTFTRAMSGGLTFAGSGDPTIEVFTREMSGGITFGGEATKTIAYTRTAGATVFHNDYQYRRLITIPANTVGSDLSNFPVPVVVTLDKTHVSDGNDFRFEDLAQSALEYQIETYDSDTGILTAWVKLPTLYAQSDNHFYLFYGLEGASDGSSTLFDDSYESVWHLVEDGDGTEDEYEDVASTNHGQGGGGTSAYVPDSVAGKFSLCGDFDGNDFIQIADGDSLTTTDDFTISAWVKPDTIYTDQCVFSRGHIDGEGNSWTLALGYSVTGKFFFHVQTTDGGDPETWTTNTLNSDSDVTADTWQHIAAVWESGVGMTIYLNGVEDGSKEIAATTLVADSGQNWIGKWNGGYLMRGLIDEVRLSGDAKTADWINAQYTLAEGSYVGSEHHAMGLGGWASYDLAAAREGSGSLTFSGSASPTVAYTRASAGGVVYGGTASEGATFARAASGGLSFGSSASPTKSYTRLPTGGIDFGSSASPTKSYTRLPDGGIDFGGAAELTIDLSRLPTGGVNFSGTADNGATYTRLPTGGLDFGGSANRGFGFAPSGGLSFGSSASPTKSYTRLPSGGLSFGGAADLANEFTRLGSGGLSFGGAADLANAFTREGLGGIVFGGHGGIGHAVEGEGGLDFGGGLDGVTYGKTPDGGLVFSGTATEATAYRRLPSGGLVFAGVASENTIRHPRQLCGTITSRPVFGGTVTAQPLLSGTIDVTCC